METVGLRIRNSMMESTKTQPSQMDIVLLESTKDQTQLQKLMIRVIQRILFS